MQGSPLPFHSFRPSRSLQRSTGLPQGLLWKQLYSTLKKEPSLSLFLSPFGIRVFMRTFVVYSSL